MITFKQYLIEATEIDISKFKNNIKIMLDKEIYLYRGTKTKRENVILSGDVEEDDIEFSDKVLTGYIADERTIERKSKMGGAASRLSDKWEIPNRKLSYFATRDAKHTKQFGELMFIIPADDVNMFAWSATDFNLGSPSLFKIKLQKLELFIDGVCRTAYYSSRQDHPDDLDKVFISILKKLSIDSTELYKIHSEDPKACKLADYVLNNLDQFDTAENNSNNYIGFKQSFIRSAVNAKILLDDIGVSTCLEAFNLASKETFKIKTFTSISDIPKKQSGADEIWFNGKYLAVNIDSVWGAERASVEILSRLIKAI